MIPRQYDSHRSGPSPPLAVWLYVLGAVSLGVSAVYGGLALMRDPVDDPLGLPVEWLDDTPFPDYFVPGLTLFTAFGVGSFVVVVSVLGRRAWAGRAAVGLGVAQLGWIGVEVFFLRRLHPLHVVFGSLGAVLVGLATRPSMREYLAGGEAMDGT